MKPSPTTGTIHHAIAALLVERPDRSERYAGVDMNPHAKLRFDEADPDQKWYVPQALRRMKTYGTDDESYERSMRRTLPRNSSLV
ncbi:hypothetical protein BH20ACT16_BH20ACT16_02250 [soil metagenome]